MLFGILKIFCLFGGWAVGIRFCGCCGSDWAQTSSPGPAGWDELAGVIEAGVCRMGWAQGEAPAAWQRVVSSVCPGQSP